jgi:hypothetical protein
MLQKSSSHHSDPRNLGIPPWQHQTLQTPRRPFESRTVLKRNIRDACVNLRLCLNGNQREDIVLPPRNSLSTPIPPPTPLAAASASNGVLGLELAGMPFYLMGGLSSGLGPMNLFPLGRRGLLPAGGAGERNGDGEGQYLNLSIMLGAKRSCRSGMRRRIWSAFLRMYCAARRRG